MRSTPAFASILASAALVACGGGSSTPDAPVVVIPDAAIDAPPPPPDEPPPPMFDFTCENDAPVTTAPAMLNIAGTVNDIDLGSQMQVPVANAAVAAFRNGTQAAIGNTTSAADGTFSFQLATGGNALDGFIEATKAGSHPVRVYPPNPLSADQANLPVLLLNNTAFGLIGMFTGVSPDAAVIVLDCAGTPIEGATLTVLQGGAAAGNVVDGSQLQPGLFFVGDLPPGDTVVGATAQGHTLHAHTVTAVAGTLITTVVTPRP